MGVVRLASCYTKVKTEGPEGWLEQRKKGVGGSDVAALMGLSKYKGPYELWAEKCGLVEPEDISGKEAVEWGHILEPVVAQHYKEAHPDRLVRAEGSTLVARLRPWAQANIDRWVRDPELGWGVLEIKTVGLRRAADWDEGVPIYYLTQVTHYMSVTGVPFADVAVLVGGQEYREYRVARDEGDVAAVDAAVDAFWEHVVKGTPPDDYAMRGSSHALMGQFASAGDEEALASDDEEALIAEWLAAKARAEKAKEEADGLSARVKQAIGSCSGISCSKGRVKWVRGQSSRLDTKRLKSDHPELCASYETTGERDMGLRFSPRKDG